MSYRYHTIYFSTAAVEVRSSCPGVLFSALPPSQPRIRLSCPAPGLPSSNIWCRVHSSYTPPLLKQPSCGRDTGERVYTAVIFTFHKLRSVLTSFCVTLASTYPKGADISRPRWRKQTPAYFTAVDRYSFVQAFTAVC